MRERDDERTVGFERGVIDAKKEGPLYRVRSLTRDGAVTRWIPAIPQHDDYEFEIGDGAYFFMFDDGRGMILGPLTD